MVLVRFLGRRSGFVLGKGDLDLVLQRAEVGIWEANRGGVWGRIFLVWCYFLSFYLEMC